MRAPDLFHNVDMLKLSTVLSKGPTTTMPAVTTTKEQLSQNYIAAATVGRPTSDYSPSSSVFSGPKNDQLPQYSQGISTQAEQEQIGYQAPDYVEDDLPSYQNEMLANYLSEGSSVPAEAQQQEEGDYLPIFREQYENKGYTNLPTTNHYFDDSSSAKPEK